MMNRKQKISFALNCLIFVFTVFFLAPKSTTTYFAYFMNSNFFMHFLTPLLCIITFAFFEPVEFSFKKTFYGTCFMILYALFYIPNILLHLDNGKVLPEYDWYGFLFAGLNTIWFVIPLLLLITWLFSICLWYINKKCAKQIATSIDKRACAFVLQGMIYGCC